MKTRIALFALTVGVFAVTGCAGTQVAVDRFGIQPGIQRFETSENTGVVETETRSFFIPDNQFGALSLFGFNGFQAEQKSVTFKLPYIFGGPLTLFNGIQLMERPLEIVFPYNQDASLTLFRSNSIQIKIMPMMDGRF
jgi:hypothetical protein